MVIVLHVTNFFGTGFTLDTFPDTTFYYLGLGPALRATQWLGWFPARESNPDHGSENTGSLATGLPGSNEKNFKHTV